MSFDIKIKKRGDTNEVYIENIDEGRVLQLIQDLRKGCMVVGWKVFQRMEEIDHIFLLRKNYDFKVTDWSRTEYYYDNYDEFWRPDPIVMMEDEYFYPESLDETHEILAKHFFWIKASKSSWKVSVAYSRRTGVLTVNWIEVTPKKDTDTFHILSMAMAKGIGEPIPFDDAAEEIEGAEKLTPKLDKKIRNAVGQLNRLVRQKSGLDNFLWVKVSSFYRNF